ncbi:MAG: hypothetical protein ACE5LC_02480 [Candidatus Aminicenantales bacterium]
MDKERKKFTSLNEEDISFLEEELRKSSRPLILGELTEKLAYMKTAHQLDQEVKKYNPYCSYEVGDSICKEYDELLNVSSKVSQHFKGTVVLKVVNKIEYKDFNCDMLEVDYAGGGIFRKYMEYMKKSKTQVLLPSNLERKAQTPEIIKREDNPQLSALPMDEKDLKTLERNIVKSLTKSVKFFNWDEHWQLTEKMVDISEGKIKEVEKYLLKKKQSAETATLVEKFFGLNSDHKDFDMHSMSLNYVLEKKYKKNFIFVSPEGWGKWAIRKTLESYLENLPVAASRASLPHFEEVEEPEKDELDLSSLKVYLTWREILSGAIKTPKALNRELSKFREYVFIDPEKRKEYTVYFYPARDFFLGLKEFYRENNVPQGASLTLEKTGLNRFNFWLKKSKKKLSVYTVEYDAQKDKLSASGEEVFTYSVPNKIIHLEKETFDRLFSLYSQINDLHLGELLVLIFKNFGIESDNFALHYQRAYHLVDILKNTSMEEVALTLHNTPEFRKSEKKKGTYFFQEEEIEEEKIEAPPEIKPEELPAQVAKPAVSAEEERPEISLEEIPASEVEPHVREPEIVERVEDFGEKPRREKLPPKEKLKKKKKPKIEAERVPRARKGEKKVIEEKIEIEELEMEALTAKKIKEERTQEEERIAAEAKKEEVKKPVVPDESVFRGIFAEKLKDALEHKDKKKKKS